MSTWNYGPFDNDEAQELLEDLRTGAFDPVELLPHSGYKRLSADEGQLIVALAALVTAQPGELPEGVSTDALRSLQQPGPKEKLRQALEATLSDSQVSDLAGYWQRQGQLHEWKAVSWATLA